ncbi:MAG: exodeoxyribonuclease V subunit alpha [Proteobacteria bacterium]|uniref:RecBCD enzyme subunit RecD n=1 Tax=Candidatus Avisuccinivibrio stercorigallinarum TaxID=2840704 RepID=A0A9D9DDZ0_9GAMM|nr:exodeoxyribonuclease V subunit alpha [Candidatus Avisuccinivibrio stercorigallinarum]
MPERSKEQQRHSEMQPELIPHAIEAGGFDDISTQQIYEEFELDAKSKADALLKAARLSPFISKIACAQADYFLRQKPKLEAGMVLLILMLQYRLEQGDICLKLTLGSDGLNAVQQRWEADHSMFYDRLDQRVVSAGEYLLYKTDEILKRFAADKKALPALIKKSGIVGRDKDDGCLLIESCSRLYFRRYYLYELNTAAFVRGHHALPYFEEHKDFIREALKLLFVKQDQGGEVNWQMAAAALATLNNFTLISGGPGTGKTTTVIRLLLLLLSLDKNRRVIELAAPTGKAAARMAEAIVSQLSDSKGELYQAAQELGRLAGLESGVNLIDLIPREARTVHRLLQVRPHQVSIYYNEQHPLPADIVVVDEVSMVDLSLFNKLLQALSPDTILILLGDKDQLCSVEAGSVLGDLAYCLQPGEQSSPFLSQECARKLAYLCDETPERIRAGSLSDFALLLSRSYRFAADSGIGKLARMVNTLPAGIPRENLAAGKLEALKTILKECSDVVYERFEFEGPKLISYVEGLVHDCVHGRKQKKGMPAKFGYSDFLDFLAKRNFVLSDEDAAEAFPLMDNFRVLCSNRGSYTGDRNLNRLIEAEVRRTYRGFGAAQGDFPGRIVLITKNDPIVGVTNGDVGFEAYERREDGSQGELRVFLPSGSSGGVKKVSPLFLSSYESGFAMTVHKSQGSEYTHTLFVTAVFPVDKNPVLTKELVYTAVTRARRALTIAGAARVFEDGVIAAEDDALIQSCLERVKRQSGLIERLYGSGE